MTVLRLLPWIGAVGLVLLLAGVLGHILAERAVALERARVAEAEQLEAEGAVVAARVEADVIRQDAAAVVAESSTLRARLEQLERRGARVTAVESLATGAVEVTAPRPPDPPEAPPLVPVLAVGDRIDLRVGRVELETTLGNRVLVAQAQAVRVYPLPEVVLAEAELRGRYEVVDDPPPARSLPWWAHVAIVAGLGALAVAVVR